MGLRLISGPKKPQVVWDRATPPSGVPPVEGGRGDWWFWARVGLVLSVPAFPIAIILFERTAKPFAVLILPFLVALPACWIWYIVASVRRSRRRDREHIEAVIDRALPPLERPIHPDEQRSLRP